MPTRALLSPSWHIRGVVRGRPDRLCGPARGDGRGFKVSFPNQMGSHPNTSIIRSTGTNDDRNAGNMCSAIVCGVHPSLR